MAKFHLGLVSESKNFESEIKSAADQVGGAYVHHSRTLLEMIHKLSMQKIQLVLLVLPAKGEASDFSSLHPFIRSKKDLANVPVCVMTEKPDLEVTNLLRDPLVRSFPLSGGFFMPLLSMSPLIAGSAADSGTVSDDWIRNEFIESLKSLVGQKLQFQVRDASEDERRSPFFAQQSGEIRTHLGWFKFTARLLESEMSGGSHLFQNLSRDMAEATAQSLMDRVIEQFVQKVNDDLRTRGAVRLPEREKLPADDRKWISSQGKHRGILFEAAECSVMLEISRYL